MNFVSAFHDWMGAPLIVSGLVVALAACSWIAIVELKRAGSRAPAEEERQPSAGSLDRTWTSLLVLALVVGAFVRVTGLDVKGLSHPEAYIPGIDLPAGISDPPPRHALVETAAWHFRSEPHPFGYYLAMWGWTKVFGASLTSIRAPGALLGVLSIFLIDRVGVSAYGTRVGVVAAGLLSLHGFHIFWSQAARMWVPGACLGLLSTWLLLEMTRTRRARPRIEWAYVLTTVAGAMTIEFYWALLCVQILWTALSHRQTSSGVPRAAVIQTLAFILSAPMLSHAMMLGRNGAAPPPSLEFLRDHFSFGFLFQHGVSTEDFYELPVAVSIAVLAASIAFIVLGLRVSTREEFAAQAPRHRCGRLCCVRAACSW